MTSNTNWLAVCVLLSGFATAAPAMAGSSSGVTVVNQTNKNLLIKFLTVKKNKVVKKGEVVAKGSKTFRWKWTGCGQYRERKLVAYRTHGSNYRGSYGQGDHDGGKRKSGHLQGLGLVF